jgi:hypothetical protein
MRKLLTTSVALAVLSLVLAPAVDAKEVGKKSTMSWAGAVSFRTAMPDKLVRSTDEGVRIPSSAKRAVNNRIADAVVYAENFDGATNTASFVDLWNLSDTWHVSTTGAFAGNSYWAADPDLGGYDEADARSLTSPAIALPGGGSPTLTFMHNYSVEGPGGEPAGFDGWDVVTVRVSTDGQTFNAVAPSSGPAYNVSSSYGAAFRYGLNAPGWGGSSGGYVSSTFSLASFAGQTVWIRFELIADNGFSSEDDASLFGWRVDNIVVADGATTIFSDDAGDTGAAQMVAGGPGSTTSWNLSTTAAVSAPNSAGFLDPATGNYSHTSHAGILTPAIAIDNLPGDTGKLEGSFQIQGSLDATPGPSGEHRDVFRVAARFYSGGHWSFWQELGTFTALPPAFAGAVADFTPLINVADSLQLRLAGYSFADGAVVTPANIFIDDVSLDAIAIQNDVAAVNVVIPFPAKVGDALNFSLNVKNTGVNPQSNVQWQGNILDATGAQLASVVGRRTDPIDPGATVAIPALTNWTPTIPGVYRVRAFTRLATDEDRSNDTTLVANDDPNTLINVFGASQYARHSPFVVHDANVLFSSRLYNLPASPTPSQLLTAGFLLRSAPAPGVVTWQTTASALIPDVNGAPGYRGAYIQFDSLGRPQDEELIIPNLDFSYVTSSAILAFKGFGTAGFTGGYTRFSIGVSSDNGQSWSDVFERRRGIDPQTGQNFGGAAFFLAAMTPGRLDITRWAAGRPNVWIRFRYEGINDGDWTLWSVAVSGRGIQAANLVSVVDIAPDQGKQVRVTWDRSANDGSLAGVPITEYGVWRREKPPGANGIVNPEPNAIVVADRQALIANIVGLKPGTRFFEASTMNHWDFVGNVIARSEARYGFVSPTLVDSLIYQFMVSAHTANPLVFGNSNIVEGFSVDNLAPDAVTLSGGPQSGFVQLNWTEPDNEEPKFYSVYRRLSSEPAFGAAIAKVGSRDYRDEDIQKSTSYVYAVTATDYGSNESKLSNELPVTTTAVAGQGVELPTNYALAQNHPNPFNPTTMISYQIPKAGEVKLTIINSLGQKVRTLVSGQVAAGYHQALWDSRDDNGNFVGSGTYLYRLEAGDFVQTKKLVLMK